MPKDYSLEDYSIPAALADLTQSQRDMIQRFIHMGVECSELDHLIQTNSAVRNYIDEQTDAKL